MRAMLVLAMLVGASFALPAASAQGSLLTDAEGDAQLQPARGGEAGVPLSGSEMSDSVDLLSLDVTETEDDLLFSLRVAGLGTTTTSALHRISFTWNEQPYRVDMRYFLFQPLETQFVDAYLVYVDEDFEFTWAWLEADFDAANGVLTAKAPKVYILDDEERPPGRGDKLTDVAVTSENNMADFLVGDNGPFQFGNEVSDFLAPRVVDEMGTDAPATITLTMGDYSMGGLVLTSPDRLRVSNGGATTFVFKLHLKNIDDAADEYRLALADLPPGWNATVQTPVKVAPGEEKTVAVLASVPFEHTHGGFDSFNVTAESARDAGTKARIRLGVLHTPIPQPSGHHPELYLHAPDWSDDPVSDAFSDTFGRSSYGYLNTVAERENEVDEIRPNIYDPDELSWWISLMPRLSMGLDLDVTQTGTLEGTLVGRVDGTMRLTPRLMYESWDEGDSTEIVVAEAEPVELTLARDQETPFSFTLTVSEDADYIPYTRYQQLYLVLEGEPQEATTGFFTSDLTVPGLVVPAFKMQLPFLEYHDRLTGTAEVAGALDLVADGPVEKIGRPGTVVTYQFDLKNTGTAPAVFVADVAGGDAVLGSLSLEGPIELAPGESRRLVLGVAIPADANDEQEFEVLVFAHAQDDPSKSAIARTKTTASRGDDAVPDESGIFLAAQRENETPGPALGAGLLALAAVAVALRRRDA